MVDTLAEPRQHRPRRRIRQWPNRSAVRRRPSATAVTSWPDEREHPLCADLTHAEHLWMPLSPCGSECLPGRGEVPTVGVARRVLRVGSAMAVLVAGILLASAFPVLRGAARRVMVRRWFGLLLRAFGVSLRVRGDRSLGGAGGTLLVTNHNSWLDVVALNAVRPVRCLAKREIRSWPVIGLLAACAGTVFVDRERLTQLPATVDRLAEVLRDGGKINVFPEGTTWCGRAGGQWRPAAFQAAIDAGVPAVPIALRYHQRRHGMSAGASFVGAQTFWDTLCRTVALRGLVVEVDIRPMLATAGRTRRELAAAAGESVTAVQSVPVDESAAAEGSGAARGDAVPDALPAPHSDGTASAA